ncbi:hypothetical protein PI124_g15279 [Phytophthora idaei]|nr:hypothetical protein PI126_g14311 [Phytophthora idaei]KAG3239787.1 hypothetical protein PI124_g15279 [Phytophthora idaei]
MVRDKTCSICRDRPHSGEAKKYKSESEVRVEAKNALDNYAYNLRNSMNGEKLKEKTPEADKKAVDDKVLETLQWLDANQAAEKEEFESGPPGSAEGVFICWRYCWRSSCATV